MGARLEEHYRMIQDAINLAEKDGFVVELATCWWGEGLVIYRGDCAEDAEERMEFEI